jgi:hypothetical protein
MRIDERLIELHIGCEPRLKLAHQRHQAGHQGDRIEQRP